MGFNLELNDTTDDVVAITSLSSRLKPIFKNSHTPQTLETLCESKNEISANNDKMEQSSYIIFA